MDALTLILLVAGFGLLLGGAEILVRGAARLAVLAGISPLVIGLTVVSLGTSAPELAVSLKATVVGTSELAIGNIVGSNIFNVLFILGLAAVIVPLSVAPQLLRFDIWLMIGVTLLVYAMSLDGLISTLDGAILTTGIVVYTGWTLYLSRRETAASSAEYDAEFDLDPGQGTRAWVKNGAYIVLGSFGLWLGSEWLVAGAVEIAAYLGVSEMLIGLTVVSIGTSLPEIAASVVAGLRGQRDIAVGNIVGSNIFNLLLVLGLTAFITPGGMPVPEDSIAFTMPVMVAVAVACLPIFFTGARITRWEGGVFLAYYGFYTAYLIMRATDFDYARQYRDALLYFVIPLTVLTMAVIYVQRRVTRSNRPA